MEFKFGHTYIKPIRLNFDWGLMQDNQRMVFRIPINDIPQDDINDYLQRISNRFRNIPLVDESNGQINLLNDYNRDYFIPTRVRNPDTPDMLFIDHISLLTP